MKAAVHDVVVIGAGLAGLQCARELTRAGVCPVVLEATDRVGGRQRTDSVDGFLLDRGFQVINPAYPALRRAVDLSVLDLHPFGAGIVVRNGRGLTTLAHPLRAPRHLPDLLLSGYVTPRSAVALLRWLGPVLVAPGRVVRGPDRQLGEALDRAGVKGPVRRVLETFLAGVLIDDTCTTSDAFARLLVRMFALGVPGLPPGGVQMLPLQLSLGLDDIRLTQPVDSVERSGGHYSVNTSGGALTARHVVVAVSPEKIASLTSLTPPPMHGLVTWWFSAPSSPTRSTMLHIDDRRGHRARGGVVNTAVVSNAVPSYAPAGGTLVQATTLIDEKGTALPEADVRRQVASIFGCNTSDWEVLARHEIPHALPAQLSPLRSAQPQVDDDGLIVCGDHRDTASIQGALVSGERAAGAVLAALGVASRP